MTQQRFVLTTDEGLPLRGDWSAAASGPAPVVVCVHGFKGFKDWGFWPEVTRRLVGAEFAVVRFNFSHSGIGEDLQTFSEPDLFETGTYTREVQDLGQVLGSIEKARIGGAPLDPGRIALLAHSRGSVSAWALAAAGGSSLRSVTLWNPVASVLWWDERARERWRRTGAWEVVNTRTGQTFRMRTSLLDDAEQNAERLDPVRNASRSAIPLLVVVATEDESVPPEAGRSLARAAPAGVAALRELPQTGHTFGAVHPPSGASPALEAAIDATIEHLRRTIPRIAA